MGFNSGFKGLTYPTVCALCGGQTDCHVLRGFASCVMLEARCYIAKGFQVMGVTSVLLVCTKLERPV